MTQSAVVVGAGQIGTAIAIRLADAGWRVTVATRGMRDLPVTLAGRVDALIVDRSAPGELARAIGTGADAVIDTIAYDETHADQLLMRREDVGHFVVISSASVYADGDGRTLDEAQANGFPAMRLPITEAQATVAPGPDTYSTRKRALEWRMLESRARTAIIRPCAVHGPEARDPREWWFVKHLLDGRPRIPLAYGGTSRFQTSATANIAAVVEATLAAGGTRILNAVDPGSPTITAIGTAIMAAVGREAELVAMPGKPAGPVGLTPWSVPNPFVLSDAAARAIGYLPVVDYAAGTIAACRWLTDRVPAKGWQAVLTGLAKYPYDLFDYAAEDRWLEEN